MRLKDIRLALARIPVNSNTGAFRGIQAVTPLGHKQRRMRKGIYGVPLLEYNADLH